MARHCHRTGLRGPPVTPAATLGWASPSSPPILVLPLWPGSIPEPWRGGGGAEAGVPAGHRHTGCPRGRFPTPGRGCGCRGAPGSPGAGRKQPAGPRAGAARSAFTRDLAEPQHLVCSWSRAPLPRPGGTAGSPPAAGGGGGGLGEGMSLGIGVHRVPSCSSSPSPARAGEVGTHPACSAPLGAALCPPHAPQGREGHPGLMLP